MNELMIKEEELKPIAFGNYAEVLEYVEQGLAKYTNIVVTDENYRDYKTDRANINKLRDAFKDKKKYLKNKYLQQIKDASDKLDSLALMCDTISKNIDEGIKAIETKRKDDKLSILTEYLLAKVDREAPSDLAGRLAWNTWLKSQEKLLNASTSIASATKTIDDYVASVSANYKIISSVYSQDAELKTIALHSFVHNGFSLEKTTEDVEAYRKNKELASKSQEQEKNSPLPTPIGADAFGNSMYQAVIVVNGTMSQLKALRGFIESNGIKLVESKIK